MKSCCLLQTEKMVGESKAMCFRKFNLVDARLQTKNKESFDHIAYWNMVALFVSSCWFYFAELSLFLIKFIGRHVFRIKMEDFSVPLEPVPESKEMEEREFNGFGEDEEEEEEEGPSSFSFKFEHQIPEVNTTINEEESFQAEAMSISNYRFLSGKFFSGFVEEPEAATFRVHESFIGNGEEKLEREFSSAREFEGVMFSKEEVSVSFSGISSDSAGQTEKLEVRSPIVSGTNSLDEKEIMESSSTFDSDSAADCEKPSIQSEDEMLLNDQNLVVRSQFSFDANFDSDSDSMSLSDGYSVKDLVVDSDCDGFLSEEDFGDKESFIDSSTFEVELVEDTDKLSQLDEAWSENDSLEAKLPSSSKVPIEFMDSGDDELRHSKNDGNISEHSDLSEAEPARAEFDSSDARPSQVDEVLGRDTEGCATNAAEEKSEETQLKDFDDEELDELESLWEHQDLIEQLKMELKRVRAVGLPTIFEESESPKTIDDLKPWKIDEAFLRGDPLDELHKFYKSYRERMRKFDILNYQKMYAIGFLQLKDPLESMGAQKPLIQTILSHFSQNLKPIFRRKSGADPSETFMKELQVDLETVYVGQTCLSWEFLRWQYEKARELPDSDPYRSHQYSQVAGEFQQFQVLLQRFIENESFQGPRLPNYVKSRCVLRNLLQVPVIKEDCLKGKLEEKKMGNFAITSEMLEDVMEESIRIFWEFVKTDKDETSIVLKGIIGNQAELQDPSDSEFMSEIQASLQKKEKRLKDILKTGNCLVKKFKKPRDGRSNHDLFFSQIDMKLVSRALKMLRITTDQLVWCHAKLSKITFSDRKIHREPSFLLFPC